MIATGVGLTLCADPFDPSANREVYRVEHKGGRVSDYLPANCLEEDAAPVLAIALNGEVLPRTAWFERYVNEGDHISAMIRPGVETVVVLVITAIVSAWQIYDATRRGKIKEHHAARRARARSRQMEDSPTYSWGGIINTINPGGPIQVLYGEHRVGGQYIKGWPQGDGTIDLILGISEGEIEGLIAGTVEINGKPVSTAYSSVTIGSQNGTTTQSGLGIFGGPSLVNSLNVTALTSGGSGAYWWGSGTRWLGSGNRLGDGTNAPVLQTKSTVNQVDGYSVRVYTGRTVPTNVAVITPALNASVQWRFDLRERTLPGGAFGAVRTFFSPVMRLTGGQITGPMNLDLRVTGLLQDDYEVEVTLNIAGSIVQTDTGVAATITDANVPAGRLWLLGYLLEFRDFDRRFPGLATLGIEGLPASTIGGVLPTVTGIWEGRKLRDVLTTGPPATFVAEAYRSVTIPGYTPGESPPLVILDILTNISYGAGEFIDVDLDLDLVSFVSARNFCDTLVSRGLNAFDPFQSGTGDGDIAALNTFSTTQAGVDFTDGSVLVDDSLSMLSGSNIDTYRIDAILSANSLRLSTAAAPFVDVVLSAEVGQDWEINNTERRCLSDHYFDGLTTIWKAVQSVAQPARLAVVRSNGKIKLIADALFGSGLSPTPVQVFGMGNITDFKTEYMGAIVANRVEIQFLDRAKNWEQQVAQFEDDQIANSTVKVRNLVRTQAEAFGVTRLSQATRIAKYHWVSNRLERELIEFQADAVTLPLEYFDVIQVVHDSAPRSGLFLDATGALRSRYPSGRIVGIDGNDVLLDDWYTWDGGFDRFLVQRSDTDVPVFLGLVSPTGTKVDRLTLGPFGAYTPVATDIFITEASLVDTPQPTLYRIIDITRTQDHRRRVRAITYDPRMYFSDPNSPELFVDEIALPELEE